MDVHISSFMRLEVGRTVEYERRTLKLNMHGRDIAWVLFHAYKLTYLSNWVFR